MGQSGGNGDSSQRVQSFSYTVNKFKDLMLSIVIIANNTTLYSSELLRE